LEKTLQRTDTDLLVAKAVGNCKKDDNVISIPQKLELGKSEKDIPN